MQITTIPTLYRILFEFTAIVTFGVAILLWFLQ